MEIDKIDLTDLELLKDRDQSFRIVIENKKYDTCHEDDLCRLLVKNDRWKSLFLIRYEYYLNKTYHGLGKGDLVFWDQTNKVLYAVELKSLKDKYSSTTDHSKITKCIDQSVKYAESAEEWSGQKAIPVTVIEYNNGEVRVEERHTQVLRQGVDIEETNPWTNGMHKINKEHITCAITDEWFSHPGDQTQTQYKINGDTLEAERIIDYEPSSGSRKSFRKRVHRVAKECTTISKYYIIMKNIEGEILMNEIHQISENLE